MTSRELLVYARHMDENGAFKKAGRRGSYTLDQMMAACTANELMALRFNRIGGEEPVFFQSDPDWNDDDDFDDAEAEEARRELGLGDLFGEDDEPWLED